MAEYYPIVHREHNFSFYGWAVDHLACCQWWLLWLVLLWAPQYSCWAALSSFGYIFRIVGLCGDSVVNTLRKSDRLLFNRAAVMLSPALSSGFPFLCVLVYTGNVANLATLWMGSAASPGCTSPTVDSTEHTFMCLLAIV